VDVVQKGMECGHVRNYQLSRRNLFHGPTASWFVRRDILLWEGQVMRPTPTV